MVSTLRSWGMLEKDETIQKLQIGEAASGSAICFPSGGT